MTFLVPVMLFGWIPLTIYFFNTKPVQQAILLSIIGGVLFLPMASYDFPVIPKYDKTTAIAISLLLAELITNKRYNYKLELSLYDIPMMVYCFISPVMTSVLNGLGLYDGVSNVLDHYISWGVIYWVGRRYFTSLKSANSICWGILLGGLLYIPFCLFEVRMSPQLSRIIYGFLPHSFLQHIRYGHYRPIVFMKHGLMVSLWIASAFITSFWLFINTNIKKLRNIPFIYVVISLAIMVVLTRSMNAVSFSLLGICCALLYKRKDSIRIFLILIALIPFYIFVRANNIVSIEVIESKFSMIFDAERIHSLTFRLNQEDLYSVKAFRRPLFGWGGWDRGKPIDPITGEKIKIVDSLWIILFSKLGFVGLISLFSAMLIGPLGVFKNLHSTKNKEYISLIILSLIVAIFMIDSLLNAMVNPVYILVAGALVSNLITIENEKVRSLKDIK